MKIAVAQINPTVGDIKANSAKILRNIKLAKSHGADLVLFSELALIGYPPKELLVKTQFVEDNLKALADIAQQCDDCAALVGHASRSQSPTGPKLHNAAALLVDGKVQATYCKQLLPTYDVFDETRYFEPARSQQVVSCAGRQLGLTICEDIWQSPHHASEPLYEVKPFADLAQAGVDLVVNISASPFVMDKHAFRCELFANQCRHYHLPLIYVNQVGGNDELIFDGCSCAFDAQGNLIAQAKDFEEDMLIIDLAKPEDSQKKQIKTEIAFISRGQEQMAEFVTECHQDISANSRLDVFLGDVWSEVCKIWLQNGFHGFVDLLDGDND